MSIVYPSTFANILHIAIESNAIDVLRICLKYGLCPNEPGKLSYQCHSTTAVDRFFSFIIFDHIGTNEKSYTLDEMLKKKKASIKYPFSCQYCLKKTNTLNSLNVPVPLNQYEMKNHYEKNNEQTKNQFDYSNFANLLTLAPMFLCVARCQHKALELLVEYGSCPNIQDQNGNTPLHLATAKANSKCEQCIYLLMKSHGFILIKNNVDNTPVGILKSNYLIHKIYDKIFNDLFNKNSKLCKSSSSMTTVTNTGTCYSGSSMHSGLNKSHLVTKMLNSLSQTNTLLSTNSSTFNNRVTNHDRNKSFSHTDIMDNNELASWFTFCTFFSLRFL
jgi:ankyrin repeat protein